MSGPHFLDIVHEQFQTRVSEIRVSMFESSGISVTLDRGASFRGYQVDHPLHHNTVVDWINLSYYFIIRQHLASLALDLGLSINGCMPRWDDYKFHAHALVYQDWVVVHPEMSSMTRFLVGGQDILVVVGKHVMFCTTLSTNSNCCHLCFFRMGTAVMATLEV